MYEGTYLKILASNDSVLIKFSQDLPREASQEVSQRLSDLISKREHPIALDLSEVRSIHELVVLTILHYIKILKDSGRDIRVELGEGPAKEAFQIFWDVVLYETSMAKRPRSLNFFERLGESVITHLRGFSEAMVFVGAMVFSTLAWLTKPSRAAKGQMVRLLEAVGVDAIPIVALISFLLGLILTFMSAVQLEQFGAQIYVASLLTISMTRELGPIITAILVAGRSGSSFASELGAMKISEEIDALRSMGFEVIRFLVVPRVIATAISLPILNFFSIWFAIFGGLLVGTLMLGLTPFAYMEETIRSIELFEIWWGNMKCVVFGVLSAGIGCFKGLQVEKGATSVGAAATSAVVTSIFYVILFDSIFAIIRVYW